jgi:uncharacterized circularly permuted ATP-grasp superfamily protein/uncharacterized alpha-E superfamily protein
MPTSAPSTGRPEPEHPAFLRGYQPSSNVHDELMDGEGRIRPHYQRVIDDLRKLGTEEFDRRWEAGKRLLRESGATYHVYGDPLGTERPWQLDPIPYVIAAADWQSLERGLVQRAQLLNLVLADCYGPQRLIRSGKLPSAVVFGQRGFLRPCHGIKPAGDVFLHLYGVDLAKSPDGRWWALSDRTQNPSGAGYALENRLVVSRILPETFREGHVQRLAGFYRSLQLGFADLGSRRNDQPRVVILSPGPFNETYFEHAYLARYLGYTLVEGEDLTVRDDRVYLKTLSGLEPVDVILRRVDDDFCDPLELRNESMLGVPGLVQALRAGNVVVANALGSGLVQTPALMSFLPSLCRELLGEELRLPSVATWWCGQRAARDHVEADLENLIVKPIAPMPGFEPTLGEGLSDPQRSELIARVRFQPHLFVAQEAVTLSTAPSWNGRQLVPMPVVTRAFLVASKGSYRLMPGGLTRVASDATSPKISMQRGGVSKDTWVLTDGPVESITLLQGAGGRGELQRIGHNLPSRIASSLFWMGRYVERAESTARIARAAVFRLTVESSAEASRLVGPLLAPLIRLGQMKAPDRKATEADWYLRAERELLRAILHRNNPGSLGVCVSHIERIATLLRDRMSLDVWRVLGNLDEPFTTCTGQGRVELTEVLELLNKVILGLAGFRGLAMDNMTRAQGWRFLDMGLRIERAVYLCETLLGALAAPDPDDTSLLDALLEIGDSSLTYRSRYNLVPQIAAVFDLLLLDELNPRSLLYQLRTLQEHLDRLPGERNGAPVSPRQSLLLECLSSLRRVDPRELSVPGVAPLETRLAEVLRLTLVNLPALSEELAQAYFAHATMSRPDDPAEPAEG